MLDPRSLPNLVVIGCLKSGTSSFHGYLGQHPDVFMSKPSELRFFNKDENWARGTEWYASFFETGRDAMIRGEKTPLYSSYPHCHDVPARMKSVIPEAKLIYLMRDPLARIRSHYVAHVVHGTETLPFEKAIVERAQYVNTSRYAMQLEQWFKHFDREQIMLLTSEQMWSQHEQTMSDVFRFLGVDPDFVPEAVPRNVTATKFVREGLTNKIRERSVGRALRHLPEPVKAPIRRHADQRGFRAEDVPAVITPAVREVLTDLLRPDVDRLKQYMPADFDAWGIA